ncbi:MULTISPECIES: site-specific integrase [unclassified Synechococcus]|uniref:site-specific integrase n=1 Tax=unclassified Synechococcus TaxID=2626047 RepID=UPI000B1EA017|nr:MULTISPECIES: site-specific integrase [unclassified Synechococcus]TWB89069.1 hypothetical protein FB106_11477 [Synechococcus sp. Ace-Pa]
MQSLAIGFDWSRASLGPALARIRNLYLLTLQGHDVHQAARILSGAVGNISRDWGTALLNFQRQKLEHGTAIQPSTWAKHYAPVLTMAVQLLDGDAAPLTPADLLDACLRGHPPGSRMRQIRAQSLAQFLRHCVDREGFAGRWRPPADLRASIGAAVAPTPGGGDPFSDTEILALIKALPNDVPGRRWADALRLLAELGLRPVELKHLAVRLELGSGELIWWCSHRKRSGGGLTEPRRIHSLPLTDWDGARQQWNLMERWRSGLLELPPLGNGPGAADALGTYLKRQPAWRSLVERLASRDERAVPYSFRHSYSLRGHQLGIDAGSVARSMGHSLEVHLRSYPWSSEAATAAAFDRALADPGPSPQLP